MNSNTICRLLLATVLTTLMATTTALCEDKTTEPSQGKVRQTRAIRYYPDGTLRSVSVNYPDGTSVKKHYNETGQLEKKINADGTEVTYRFRVEDGIKEVEETHADTTVTRRFDPQGYIVMSKYADRLEKYSYEKDQYGDVQSVTIEYDNDSTVTIPPTDKRLSFLWDYDIIGSDDIPLYQNMEEKEYLFNPKRYKERMEMHKRFR